MKQNRNIKNIHVNEYFNFIIPTADEKKIRLGRNLDGGYIVPENQINKENILITFGVGPDWSFEIDYLKKSPRNLVYCYDYSVSTYFYFEDAMLSFFKNIFLKSNIKNMITRFKRYFEWKKFIKNKNVKFQSKRLFDRNQFNDCLTVAEIIDSLPKKTNLIIKCDIEGGEYRIIDDIVKFQERIDCLIIEFHDINPLKETFKLNFEKIIEKFDVMHIHPNNSAGYGICGFPDVIEVTFVKKKNDVYRIIDRSNKIETLTELDFPCDPRLPEINLRFN